MEKHEKPRVLLVDDNDATCTLVTALLQREFQIDIANDGLEALERIKTTDYRAILLDLRMPQLDGFGVLDYLRTNRPELVKRVVVLTASLTQKDVARVKTFPVWGIVAKPFEVEALLNSVKSCVSTASSAIGGIFASGVVAVIADLLRNRMF